MKKKNFEFRFFVWVVFFAFVVLPGCTHLKTAERPTQDAETQKVYGWLKSLQLPNGLLESSDGSNFVSLYDNALAAIVFSTQGDFDRAEKIFDYFNQNIENELKKSPGGFGQFRDRRGVPLGGKPNRWLGDNAWLLIALNNYHNLAGNKKYGELAAAIETWIRSLQDETDGSLCGGFDEGGKKIVKSTEGMIDAFNAVGGYDSFHSKMLQYLKTQLWDPQEKTFLAWKEHPQYKYALDLHSWGFCALQKMPPLLLEQTDRYRTTKTAAINGKNITGFCFDVDLDTIWLEGTGEMVVAYRSAGMDCLAEYYLRELEKMIVASSRNNSFGGIPYSTNPGTHYGWGKLWEGAERNPSIASSAWYLMGKWKYDPMKAGKDKSIPPEDIFWANNDDKHN